MLVELRLLLLLDASAAAAATGRGGRVMVEVVMSDF